MINEIIENIDVNAPYFALSNMSLQADEVRAEMCREQPMYSELGCMSAAETGRHLAILGSCALAGTNPKKKTHYYLAHRARLKMHPENKSNDVQGLYAVAQSTGFTKRQGEACSVLFDSDDRAMATLETSYHVIEAPSFARIFGHKSVTNPKSESNPYTQEFELDVASIGGGKLSATLGPIDVQQCNGHFDSIPCLPVAILMHALSRAAALVLSDVVGQDVKHFLEEATITADNLAFPGDVINIEASHLGGEGNTHSFLCEAKDVEGNLYGSLNATLRAEPDL